MDAVYLVKRDQENPELRYSLRSLQNLPHDNVHFVGFKPRWVTDKVNHIWCEFKAPNIDNHPKWHISWQMLRHACLDESIPDDFILFNDDFFVMQPIIEIPILHRGEIGDIISGTKGRVSKSNKYVFAMIETRELLVTLEKPTLCYEMHTPMVINKHQMLTCMEIVDAMTRDGLKHINKRSIYGNYWEIGGQQAIDVKVDSLYPLFDKDNTFLSTTEGSFISKPVGSFIRSKFPKPSPYERGTSRAKPYKPRSSGPVIRPPTGNRRAVNR